MAELQAKPEQEARVTIDEMLESAGWVVQDYKAMDLTAGIGVAVREFPTKTGPVDYLLFANEKAIGTVEAKKAGTTLLGVEAQSQRYVKGFEELVKTRPVPYWGEKPLPFAYQTTGVETKFTSWLDPIARPRDVFISTFQRPSWSGCRSRNHFVTEFARCPSLERPACERRKSRR